VKTPHSFATALAETRLPSVFNPYRETCCVHDRPDAADVRRRNLVRCLEAALDARVDTIWIARDLGYRGGRRTGVPLTDEIHLAQAGGLMGGIELERATHGPVVAERTAAIVWRVLSHIRQPVVLWNIFPLHPHEADDPLSNRCHTRAEREATWPWLTALIAMIRPRRIVAIGRDAGLALSKIDIPVHIVRHPSYGGQADFVAGVHAIYDVAENAEAKDSSPLPLPGARAAIGAAARSKLAIIEATSERRPRFGKSISA
jgi:uracil-DNA glycosylase